MIKVPKGLIPKGLNLPETLGHFLTMKKALRSFLIIIERDAAYSYTTWQNGKNYWNEEIWKANDPEYYKYWKKLADMVGGIPLSKVRK